jgi:hypothetical protein
MLNNRLLFTRMIEWNGGLHTEPTLLGAMLSLVGGSLLAFVLMLGLGWAIAIFS